MPTSFRGSLVLSAGIKAGQIGSRDTERTIDPGLLTLALDSGIEQYDRPDIMPADHYSSVTLALSAMHDFPTYPRAPSKEGMHAYFEDGPDTQVVPICRDEPWVPPEDIQMYTVSSPGDIKRWYDEIFEYPLFNADLEMRAFWRSGTQYAACICAAISRLLKTGYYDPSWFAKIEASLGWRNYSLSTINRPFDPTGIVACFLGDETKLNALLATLEDAYNALDEVRSRFILDYGLDPWQPSEKSSIMQLETSDSCEIEEDDDDRYHQQREALQTFQNDPDRSLYMTEPIEVARLRKDIRAWARIARFRCIKLPCSSMLIHKHGRLLPQRRRRQRRQQRDRWEDEFGFLTSTFQAFSRPRSYGNSGRQSEYSSGSGSSADRARVGKKKKLPREKGGYICDFHDCPRAFDRQCDLRHHQRSHRPKDTLPYACEHCDRRFGFPKDLRRHEKSHQLPGTSEDR